MRERRSRRERRVERILILGATPLAEQIVGELTARPRRHRVVGIVDDAVPRAGRAVSALFLGGLASLRAVVDEHRPHRIVVALAERRSRTPMQALLESHAAHGVVVEDASEFYEQLTGKVLLEALTPMRHLAPSRLGSPRRQHVLPRALSVLVAVIALVGLAPLFGLIAAAIKLDSTGPVLFRQRRVGAQGRTFTLLKFRTMHERPTRSSEWEDDNRDRITRVGRWLRRFRLDELPQFVNILRGEMNLVGPRPHPVSNLELFTLVARNLNEWTGAAIGCYALRLSVRPGLTGWAQVRYRYANNLDEEIEKLRYDLYYVKNRSLWLDLRILLETLTVMVRGRGARAASGAAGAPAWRLRRLHKLNGTTEA